MTAEDLAQIIPQTETRMKKAIEALRHELTTIRTGRAAPALVEGLEVDAYGSAMPLIQLAQINAPEPRMISMRSMLSRGIADQRSATISFSFSR